MIDEQLKQKLIAFVDESMDFDEPDMYMEIVQDGDWISEYKWQTKETVVRFNCQYYAVVQQRSGSYWSDYEYSDPDVYEVEPVEVTKIEYKVKK